MAEQGPIQALSPKLAKFMVRLNRLSEVAAQIIKISLIRVWQNEPHEWYDYGRI